MQRECTRFSRQLTQYTNNEGCFVSVKCKSHLCFLSMLFVSVMLLL
jgi:hypothetical protein